MHDSRPTNSLNATDPPALSEGGGIRTLVRYVSAVRDRKAIVLLCIAISCSAGLAYFAFTPRVYESRAEVLIKAVARDDRLLVSEPVLGDAVTQLEENGIVDFDDIPESERTEYLRDRLIVRKPGGRSDILQLRYRCSDPRESSAALNCIIKSFKAYLGPYDATEGQVAIGQGVGSPTHLLRELMGRMALLEKRQAKKKAELFKLLNRMKKLQENDENGKSDGSVRQVGGNAEKAGSKNANFDPSQEPVRFMPESASELLKNARLKGLSPNDIQRAEMLIHEMRLLGDLRNLIGFLADNAAEEKRREAKVEIIEKPVTPTDPATPRSLSQVLFGSVTFGLTIGLAVVFLLESLDDRFRSQAELSYALSVPVVGSIDIPVHAGGKSVPGNIAATGDSPERQHRGHSAILAINAVRRSNRCVVVTHVNSPGKAASAAMEIAKSYCLTGHRVLLIEDELSGQASNGGEPSSSSMPGKAIDAPIDRVETIDTGHGKIDRLGNSVLSLEINADTAAATNRLVDLLQAALERYDRVIVSASPPQTSATAAIAGRLVGGALLAVTASVDSRTETVNAANLLQLQGCPVWGVVVDSDGLNREWTNSGLGLIASSPTSASVPPGNGGRAADSNAIPFILEPSTTAPNATNAGPTQQAA